MPGSPRSRPVTTTGAPKPPAPRAAGATTRPSASAKVDTCAFMVGMHSRGEESPGSPLRDAIGERCEKKGGVIESPTWVRVAGRASGRGAWYTRLARAAPDQLHSADAAAPLPPSRRPRLPHRPRGVGRRCRGRGDDLGPRGRHVPRTRHVRRRAPADLPQRPGERPLLLLLRGAQAVAGRGGRRSRAGGSACARARAPATGRRRRRAPGYYSVMDRIALGLMPLRDASPRDVVAWSERAEALGFEAVFISESYGDSLAYAEAVALDTDHLRVGTAITNVYLRQPTLL